jgi:tyrosyl-tRNA synthetase
MQVDDAALERHLMWFTLLPREDVAALLAAHEADPGARPAHRALAHEVTAIVHGEAAAVAAQGATDVLFGGDPTHASAAALATAASEMPVVPLLGGPMPLVSVALREAGLVASSGEARRAIGQGGVYLNGERLAGDRELAAEDLLHGEYALLRKGKRSYAMGVLTPDQDL